MSTYDRDLVDVLKLFALQSFTEAIGLDSNYALAFAGRSLALIDNSTNFVTGEAIPEGFAKALADARHALALAPELAEGQMALAEIFAWGSHDFAQANEAWERAKSLAPGDARILREYGLFAATMSRPDAVLVGARRALVLDPLGARSHFALGQTLFLARSIPGVGGGLQGCLGNAPMRKYSLRN